MKKKKIYLGILILCIFTLIYARKDKLPSGLDESWNKARKVSISAGTQGRFFYGWLKIGVSGLTKQYYTTDEGKHKHGLIAKLWLSEAECGGYGANCEGKFVFVWPGRIIKWHGHSIYTKKVHKYLRLKEKAQKVINKWVNKMAGVKDWRPHMDGRSDGYVTLWIKGAKPPERFLRIKQFLAEGKPVPARFLPKKKKIKKRIQKKQKFEKMALIPKGYFMMGSEEGGANQRPRHKVYLDAFYIDKYEVTVSQFREFAQAADLYMKQPRWNGDEYPVVNVLWFDAKDYCEWAGKRLPTEAEWEKAARGGMDTKYSFGNDESKLKDYAWYKGNSEGKLHPVGQKKPNQYGLYDMYGNADEWVSDWYDKNYYKNSPEKNPKGPDSGRDRVVRSCSWECIKEYDVDSAARRGYMPNLSIDDIGFRCASSVK